VKTFRSFLVAALILVMAALPLISQAGTTYDQAVSKLDLWGTLVYKGTVTFTDSASGAIYYTQRMFTGAVNASDGLARFICSEKGTEDVNVFIEYSVDGENWTVGTTDADVDAVGTTAVTDTVGIVQGVDQYLFHIYPYMRFKFVAGQAINSTTVTWAVAFRKPAGSELKYLGAVKNTQ